MFARKLIESITNYLLSISIIFFFGGVLGISLPSLLFLLFAGQGLVYGSRLDKWDCLVKSRRHIGLEDFRHRDAFIGLVVFQDHTYGPRSGAHGRIQHVHKFNLCGCVVHLWMCVWMCGVVWMCVDVCGCVLYMCSVLWMCVDVCVDVCCACVVCCGCVYGCVCGCVLCMCGCVWMCVWMCGVCVDVCCACVVCVDVCVRVYTHTPL